MHRLVGNGDRPRRFYQIPEKKVGQDHVITVAIDGNCISWLITKEIGPAMPQSAFSELSYRISGSKVQNIVLYHSILSEFVQECIELVVLDLR